MRLQLDTNIAGAAGSAAPGVGGASGAKAGSSAANAADTVGNNFGSQLDSTSISGPSSLLNRLNADQNSRIQALTAAVQGGTYQISSTAISGALVAEALL